MSLRRYINCPQCVESNSKGPVNVEITDEGGLTITCLDHDHIFFSACNHQIAELLRDIGSSGPDCGHDEKKESVH